MNQYIVLNIEMPTWNTTEVIHPVVVTDDSHRVLIDCGYVGSLPKIEEALKLNNIMPETISHIILTHQDHDHMGAAAAFKRKYPDVKIMASETEAPYVSGEKKSLRLIQAEQLQESLPAEQKAFGEAFCRLLRSIEPVGVDCILTPNSEMPFCGGCYIIPTPGHTPGHISIHVPALDVVITGDAMALENGKPVIANPQFTLNLNEAVSSIESLHSLGVKNIICYHGGILR